MVRAFFLSLFFCLSCLFFVYADQKASSGKKYSQADSLFDESDLEDIEGVEIEEEEVLKEDSKEDLQPEDNFNIEDYEIISDRPDYEMISDEDLEKEFIQNTDQEEDSLSEEEDEDLETADEEGAEVLDKDLDESDFDLEEIEDEQEEEPETSISVDESEEEEPEALDQQSSEDVSIEDIVSEEEASADSLNLITNIRFLASKDQIVIDCSESTSFQVRKNIEKQQFVIEILQARLGKNLHWPYILRDFKTNFGLIKADQKDSNTVRVVVQLKKDIGFPQAVLMENNNQILISYGEINEQNMTSESITNKTSVDPSDILPAKTLGDLYLKDVQFSGAPISFHVIDAPVKQVLRFISEESGLNMVIGEKVDGKITLKLEDVPWDQALYTIFKVKSLGYARDGNVITIMPLTEIEERTKKLKEISDQQKSLTPFITKVIPISYGNLKEIEGKIKDFLTKTAGQQAGQVGKIITHQESGSLILIDTPEAIEKMEKLARYLDKPPKQVMVEAKIVEVSKTFTRNFGLRWALGGNLPVSVNAGGLLQLLGNISGNYALGSSGDMGLTLNGLPLIGDIGANLSLAESEGYAQVISTPKMVVISGKSATINRNAPILVARTENETAGTQAGGVSRTRSLEKEDISISMKVTPTVTTTGSVFIQLDVTRTEPGSSAGSEGETLKVERTAKTEVLAKNGQTIVVGGIYEWDTGGGSTGIPILGSIPFLNLLFKSKNKRQSSSELLVFITPKLLDSHE